MTDIADLVEATLSLGENAPRLEHRRRGGDPRQDKRARRDAALRRLASLIGDGASVEQQARTLADRLKRYKPVPGERNPERLLMRQVVDIGLRVPGPDRLARILRSCDQKADWIPDDRHHHRLCG